MTANGLTQEINARWTRVRGVLRAEVGDSAYKSWLKPLGLVEFSGGVVRLSVPTRFMRDWIANHYGTRISELWCDGNSPVAEVEIFVLSDAEDTRTQTPPKAPSETAVSATAGARVSPDRVDGDVSSALDPRFKFDNFVVGKPNELAYAAARRVADAETATYNPLFLYGGVGLGKTHLMHA
ncbi:MAG: chromosomal replication initiator protein DnaA, partial [Alphaproteobacteria bacterium]|nr:chromosomal replication initiator protein DnaA [Alphaproteobacteria bacterium]